MTTIEVKNASGAKASEVNLNETIFDIEPNMYAMHDVVRAQLASQHQGTHNTLTRGNVRGGGKKPWRQKGTGRARQGSIRSPQWNGGGVVFGPHPRSYDLKVPKKVIKLAMRSALSAKLSDNELLIVDEFNFDKPSTKQAVQFLKNLELHGKRITLIVGDEDLNSFLSFRNIKVVRIIGASEINTYDFIDNKCLVITNEALEYIEGALA